MRNPWSGNLFLVLLLQWSAFAPQASAQNEIVGGTSGFFTYSENQRFYVRSTPHDTERQNPRGQSAVYEVGRNEPLYVLERDFEEPFFNPLFLSDDGRVIVYVLAADAPETPEAMRSVTAYRDGRLVRSYTAFDVTGCDERTAPCTLLYWNYDEVIDRGATAAAPGQQKVFKAGVSEQERFLCDYAAFAASGVVYLTDSLKRVHRFSLADGSVLGSEPFESAYERMKAVGRKNRIETFEFDVIDTLGSLPRLADGRDATAALAARLGMEPIRSDDRSQSDYRWHTIDVAGTLSRDGRIEIEQMETDGNLDQAAIIDFFSTARFETRLIPKPCEKWFSRFQVQLRNRDKRIARTERRAQIVAEQRERERRRTVETIDGAYVPKDLGDCLTELDKLVPEASKSEMRALPTRDEMTRYQMGLGTTLRSRWGLWGGSRLEKYFKERGMEHPDDMSGIILRYYYDWLRGDRDGWSGWEKQKPAIR